MLFRGLDAVVATAAAEEMEDAFTIPFEADVAFAVGSVSAIGSGAVVAEASESFGFSAERSSPERFVSIK